MMKPCDWCYVWTFCKKTTKNNDLEYHYASDSDRTRLHSSKHVDAKAEFVELKETMQKLEDFELRQDMILKKEQKKTK